MDVDRWDHDPRTGPHQDKHGRFVLADRYITDVRDLRAEIATLKARDVPTSTPRLSSGTLCVIGLAMVCYNEHMGSKPAGVIKAEAELEELRKAQVDGAPTLSAVRFVDKDNPETWPPDNDSYIAVWDKEAINHPFLSKGGLIGPTSWSEGDYIAWMSLPIVPGT